MSSSNSKEAWTSGVAYEQYVGRWSRLVAQEFISWLELPSGLQWLDLGCGTGRLSQTVLTLASPAEVKGIDQSENFASFARDQVQDKRASFQVGDAQKIALGDASFDAVVSGLVLNFIPNQSQALAEMSRVVRPGGTIAAYVWDYAGQMQLMRYFWDAAVALDPLALNLVEGLRFPICQPEPLKQLFQTTGLNEIAVRAIDVPTTFQNFDDYWSPFLGGQGPAPGYALALNEERRAALRERIRAALPVEADGSIHLIARAWAVRGKRPA